MRVNGWFSRSMVLLLLAWLAGCVATPGAGPTAQPPAATASPQGAGVACRLLTPEPQEPSSAGTPMVSTAVASGGSTPLTALPTAVPPTPAASVPLTNTALRYRLIERFGDVAFCDPDMYPVAHGDEQERALAWFAQAGPASEEVRTIVQVKGLGQADALTPEQQLTVYREHKKLAAMRLEACEGGFAFQFATVKDVMVTGQVNAEGAISVVSEKPFTLNCPICLAYGTLIDTPSGTVSVQDLRPGMVVWSVDAAGRRVEAKLLRTARTPVSAEHVVVHVRLDDGREVWASPGHPTADGRTLGGLEPGDVLDGARVIALASERYAGGTTYDLLPDSATGAYWANGVLLGSTLGSSR